MVLPHPQLARRAVHALAGLPAQLGLLDLHAAWQRGADSRHRHLVACLEVVSPAHDSQSTLDTDVDGSHPQLVGVRVALLGHYLAHDHTVEVRPGLLDALDSRARHV